MVYYSPNFCVNYFVTFRQARFLATPYGRAGFYFFMGLLLACEGFLVDLIAGCFMSCIGIVIFYSSYRMYHALRDLMKPEYTQAAIITKFREFSGSDNKMNSEELTKLFASLGHNLNRYELEAALLDLDENDDGEKLK